MITAARRNAAAVNRPGAMFPWHSGATGTWDCLYDATGTQDYLYGATGTLDLSTVICMSAKQPFAKELLNILRWNGS